jgi:hypothetical protein
MTMNWPFRRTQRPLSRFRPTLEALEGRDLPSVSVATFTDNGAQGLRLVATGRQDTITITDDSVHGTTTVVENGVTKTFSQQFAEFDLRLLANNDSLTFNLAGAYTGRQASVQVDLGTGTNHFNFNPGQTAIDAGSNVGLNVQGHNGNDFVDLAFGEIANSALNVLETGIGGSKMPLTSMSPVRDSITFGTGKTGILNSSVNINVGLGTGNTNFQFNYGADLGHLGSSFVPSTFNVTITGSSRAQDVDNVTLLATGEANQGSTLNFNVDFVKGNDAFHGIFDANSFQVDDDNGGQVGGFFNLNLRGGTGNDTFDVHSINQDHTIELSGQLGINIVAGTGNDNINVDFGGAGFTDDDPFELGATNRQLLLRIQGGQGNDKINVNLANADTATFAYDVAVVGGTGTNDISFTGNNAGGSPTFGPSGAIQLDGGFGTDNDITVAGNFPVHTAHVNS